MTETNHYASLEPVRIGVVGAGNISGQYFEALAKFAMTPIVAVADLDLNRARAKAGDYGVEHALTVDELFARDDIDLVVNLTIPAAHVEICERAIESGKHTHVEKPLALDRKSALRLKEKADTKGLRVGCAPDTFLGAGLQTARHIIDSGKLGDITAVTAFMVSRGHEHWHPDPDYYYQPGAGPMLDMGPYYLTALLNLLGPVDTISGMTSVAIPQRTITSDAKRGQTIDVNTPDHYCGTMRFSSGVVGSIIQTFAMRNAPAIQPFTIFGTDATMNVPDPNGFDEKVYLNFEGGDDQWHEQPMSHATGHGRGIGVLDMAVAIRENRPHRCGFDQAMTVLDLMLGFDESSRSGSFHRVIDGYERPAPMPAGGDFGNVDLTQ